MLRSAGDGTSELNYANPVQRDTVNIGLLGDNVTIRFEVRPYICRPARGCLIEVAGRQTILARGSSTVILIST